MKINEIEKTLNIPRASVRFYEKEGLLHPTRSENGYRDYSDDDISQLKRIIVLRKIGLTVAEIRDIDDGALNLYDAINTNIRRLKGERDEINAALDVCKSMIADQDEAYLDEDYYYSKIANMETAGSRFMSLARDIIEYEEDKLRQTSWLSWRRVPLMQEIGHFAMVVFATLIGMTIPKLILPGEDPWDTLIKLPIWLPLMLLFMIVIIAGLYFLEKKGKKVSTRMMVIVEIASCVCALLIVDFI